MLYIFRILGAPFLKLGFTQHDQRRRVATGFWGNVRPAERCNQLGYEHLQLLALFEGSLSDEAAIKLAFPPTTGEFWPSVMLGPLMALMKFMNNELPLPPKPSSPPVVGREIEKLPCCGGRTYHCFNCNIVFNRWRHLTQHRESCLDQKVACTKCSKKVLKRNLKRHHQNCKR